MTQPDDATNADLSHGLLVAVLTSLGGSHDLHLSQLQPDAMGNRAGEFYGVEMQPLDEQRVRLAVVPQSERTAGGES